MSAAPSHSGHARIGLHPLGWIALFAAAVVLGWLIVYSFQHAGQPHASHLPHYWGLGVVPFAGILACIAALPLIPATQHWWESNRNRLIVSAAFALLTIVYYLLVEGAGAVPRVLSHAIVDHYVPFIVLLFALYVISGGINLKGDLPAHPITNTAFLAIGAAIASFIGTTGASMLLIRPLLQTNSERKRITHTVIFFIFLVSNIGGTLLPIGDPPLFLGYLRGVPFEWTLVAVEGCGCLVLRGSAGRLLRGGTRIAYEGGDPVDAARRTCASRSVCAAGSTSPLAAGGGPGGLAVVPGRSSAVLDLPAAARGLILLGLTWPVIDDARRAVRAARNNRFNYSAIIEVAALFVGIFITMGADWVPRTPAGRTGSCDPGASSGPPAPVEHSRQRADLRGVLRDRPTP